MTEDSTTIVKLTNRTEYRLNGILHREDGPAVEYANGTRGWYKNGIFHREDGPAIETLKGNQIWFREGKYHRLGGPAILYIEAYESPGSKSWLVDGKLHRLDGPAFEFPKDGIKTWAIYGEECPKLHVDYFRLKTLSISLLVNRRVWKKTI